MTEDAQPATAETQAAAQAQTEAEIKAETAEKRRKARRSDAQLIADGILEIKARFEAFASEQVNASLEAALDRGEVVTAQECQRRINAAKAEVRAELRRFLADDGK